MSTAKTTNLNIRIDKDVKRQAEELLYDMGLNLSTAVNVYIRQLIREGNIPFRIGAYKEDLALYDLKFIRQKLAEAENEAANPDVKLLDMNEVMGKYQEKYGYEI